MNLRFRPRLNNATTFQLLRQLLKGNKVEELNFSAEIIELPSEDGVYKKHATTGRKTVTIVVVPR